MSWKWNTIKLKKYGEPSTKYDMVRWLLTKVKNKTLDF